MVPFLILTNLLTCSLSATTKHHFPTTNQGQAEAGAEPLPGAPAGAGDEQHAAAGGEHGALRALLPRGRQGQPHEPDSGPGGRGQGRGSGPGAGGVSR